MSTEGLLMSLLSICTAPGMRSALHMLVAIQIPRIMGELYKAPMDISFLSFSLQIRVSSIVCLNCYPTLGS